MDARRYRYLQAMGIQPWVPRTATTASDGDEQPRPTPVSPAPAVQAEPDPQVVAAPPPATAPAHSGTPAASEITQLDWDALQQRVSQCQLCELSQGRTQTVFGVGNRQADLLVIGEAPGAEEDRQGEPFVGRAGQLLNAMLAAIGLDRDTVYIANILKCRPPNNRDPKAEEVVACEPYLQRQIQLLQPKAILAVGRIAAHNLLKTDAPLSRLRGQALNYSDPQIPVVVSYHPAYLLRTPADKAKAWQDLKRLKSLGVGQ